MQSNYLGGVKAINWRKKVALTNRRDNDAYNRTFKFPLEINEDLSEILPQAEALYDLIEKTDKGSLAGLVFAVHLSGFRLFGSKNETRTFETQEQFPDAEFGEISSITFQNMPSTICPSEIYNTLKKIPRGKNATWSEEQILARLKKDLKLPNKNVDEKLLDVIRSVAHTIYQEKSYENWKDVSDAPQVAFEGFASAFRKIDSAFPKFPSLLQIENKAIKEGRILSYDREMIFYDMESDKNEEYPNYWIYHSISVIAKSLNKEEPTESLAAKKIQNRLTTESNNALSWLFGEGLLWLQNASLEDVCEELGVPDNESHRVSQLQSFAKALPCKDPVWKQKGFSKFRAKVGGKLDGWVKNYWKRLDALRKDFEKSPKITIHDALLGENYNHLFIGNNLSAPNIKNAIEKILPHKINNAMKAVHVLQGKADCDANIGDAVKAVDEITEYLDALLGEIEILNNHIEQKKGNEETPDRTEQWEQLKINTQNIKKPDRLNRIGGGVICADTITKEIEHSVNVLLKARQGHYKNLMAYTTKYGNTDPLDNIIAMERKKLEDRHQDTGKAEENARRYMLHGFAILANRMSEETRKNLIEIVRPAFPEKYENGPKKGRKNRDANKFFYNRQGAIYVSPFSTRRHDAYSLADTALTENWLARAESLLDSVSKKLQNSETPGLLKDMVILEGYTFAMRLRCIPESIPANLSKHALEMHENEKMFIPATLRAQFTDPDTDVSRDAVLRLFNLYASALNGLMFRTGRSGFITRVVFSREGTDKLIYAPKPKAEWTPPKPYHEGQSPVASALRKNWVVWKEKNHIVDVEKTFSNLCNNKKLGNAAEVAAYLAQAPHDWWLKLDIEGIGEKRYGITVSTSSKGTFSNVGKPHAGLARLRGPSSRRTMLDRTLWMHIRGNKLQFGDPNLIIDTQYSQKADLKDGSPRIQINRESTKMNAAILLVDKTVSNESFDIYNRIVAIDLGERGIGYAVFDLREYMRTEKTQPMIDPQGRPIAGTVSAPSIRALIRAARNHRGRSQPQQKVNLNYSTLLQQRRENVVGDVCNRIDALCEKHGGFPVLESTVGNLESGSKQLELVYNSVIKMYLYDAETSARNTKRQHRWVCAKQWQHPWLVKRKYDNDKKTWLDQGDGPYTLYPGASVAPAGTSQTCHRCNRNPILGIKILDGSSADVKEGGLIRLSGGHEIKLYDGSDPPTGEEKEEWEKRMRRENKRMPLNRPMKAGRRGKDEISRCLKRNLRRPNPSLQSPDTTQSRYHCVYTDCDFEGHADVNAAINIGVKFLNERVYLKDSQLELEENKLKSLSE